MRIVRCRSCRLIYLANAPDDAHFYNEYHHAADAYAAADYRSDSRTPALAELWQINHQRVQWLVRHAPGKKLLDIGCGRGFFLHSAAGARFTVEGVDISAVAVDFARDELGLTASTATLDVLIEQGRRYDIVTLWHVLEHFADPLAELRKIHRLLADEGLCVIEVPNVNSAFFLLAGRRWHGGNHPRYHRTFFSAHTLAAALRTSGFAASQRIRLNYRLPGRSGATELVKRICNIAARDSFLDFAATK